MQLQDIITHDKVLAIAQIKADPELLKQIQTRLADLNWYPPHMIDGEWGALTEGAISLFCKQAHLDNAKTGLFGASWAKALIEAIAAPRTISSKGIDLIAEFEGCRLNAYRCPAGVPTIGYGHTRGVKMGDRLKSVVAAKQLLLEDLENEYIPGVLACVKVPLTQNQLDALVSLAYNIGVGALSKSTLIRKLNAEDYQGASAEFLKWNRAAGQVLPGLSRRRRAEKQLFQS